MGNITISDDERKNEEVSAEAPDYELDQLLKLEQLKFYREHNRRRERYEHERRQAEVRAKRWGYPIPRGLRR